jgi:hypothetical protein
MIESMAKCKSKSQLDLRNGCWHVGFVKGQKELSAFTIPNARSLRWPCMLFGIQGVPERFQEMMKILIEKNKSLQYSL